MSKIALFFDQKVASFLVTLLAPNLSQIYGYLVANSSQMCSFFSQKYGQNRSKITQNHPKSAPFYRYQVSVAPKPFYFTHFCQKQAPKIPQKTGVKNTSFLALFCYILQSGIWTLKKVVFTKRSFFRAKIQKY